MFDWQKIEQIKSTTLSELVAKKLYDCMMDAPTNQALEFGSYLGKSAVTIGAAAKEREGTLLCLDYFPEEVLAKFMLNVKEHQLENTIIPIRINHSEAVKNIFGKFGLIYIDGNHIAQYVIPQARWAWEHIVDGGWIGFHDYGSSFPDIPICVDLLARQWKRTPEIITNAAFIKK